MSRAAPTAAEMVAALGLAPHPEGGWYRETYRDAPADGGRGAVTSILFLLAAGQVSHWHRVDAAEIWYWQGGAPLLLDLSADGRTVGPSHRLGLDPAAGEVPQATVPAGVWQSARGLGTWTLVGCAVAPAFTFAGFEMAPPGWSPGGPFDG